jgi:hypothetical protein
MDAAAVADDDDEYYGAAGPMHAQHGVQRQQQQQQHALSAADVLRRSSSSRQQLSHSLVQGLRRASSEAASAAVAAGERRSSDGGSSGLGVSALDVADSRDNAAYLRGTSSASKQEQHGSRTRGRGNKGSGQLFASWQPGSVSKHMDSSILKALQPSGSQRRTRHQRQDQAVAAAVAAAVAPGGATWAMVNSPIHAVVKGGGRQRRLSRALDLLQDDDSGSDA